MQNQILKFICKIHKHRERMRECNKNHINHKIDNYQNQTINGKR